ncbi:MAG: PAS domain S-box protein [Burkholderiales bacterium]|nr:PAS domain S-box protein [Burkholderiales bacterium]
MNEQDGRAAEEGAFRRVIENVAAGIMVLQDDRLAFVNARAARLLGRDAAALVGVDPATLLSDGERGRPAESYRALVDGQAEEDYSEYRITLPDGRVRHLAVSATRSDWNGRPAMLGVLHDISRQRAAMAALRGSEERYRTMIESLNEGVMMFDDQARLKGVNAAAERLLGMNFERMRHNRVADWQPVGLDGEVMAPDQIPIARVLASGKPVRHALLGMRIPDHGTRWLEVNCEPLHDGGGAVTGGLLSFTDVTEARRVEEALRVSESTNRTLMDALADGVFVAQDLHFVYANRLLLERLGYEREEFVGLPFERVVAPDLLETWIERFRGRVARGPEPLRTYEVRFLRKDGGLAEFELVANRTTFQNRPAVLGVLRDIAERKSAAAELERHRDRLEELVHQRTRALEAAVAARIQSENFAQTMTDHQPTLLAYVDRAHQVQFANRAWLGWFGKTRDEVIGRDVRESVGAVMLQPDEDVVAKVLRGEAQGTAAEMRGADGRVGNFWIYRLPDVVDGDIRGYFFIATDVTEMRRSERRLQELNGKLIQAESFTRGIADNLPVRVAYWDADERCRFANKVYCEWIGKSLDQVLGKTKAEIFDYGQKPERLAHAKRALEGSTQKFESEEVSADGRYGIWEVQYIPDLQRGEVRGFFMLASDITASKRAQADLETLNLELVAARDAAEEAAQAKSAFLANMSHEIRTPMNVIIGLTHLMQRDAHDAATSDRLGKVGDAAMHLLDIINDILDLSKIDAGKLVLAPVDFSVDALLARAMALVTDGARRKGLALTVDRGNLPQALRGDALRLSQVLVNLLSNAVKFTSRGSVVLRCDVVGQAGSEWTIRFSVRDTGVGISPEAQARLFTPFEQADGSTTRRFGGTGLGLSIARELAQLMGGEVGVESEPGRGSEFWFTARLQAAGALPHAAAGPVDAVIDGQGVERALKARHAGARVLIADDNRINQELATELLRLVGLKVEVADNGRIAVDMARRGTFDMILMDMQMPELDGLEATRQIRAEPRLDATPIVAMTASAFGADRDACLAAGMNDHLGKPVNPAALYDKMLRWLDESRKAPRRAPVDAPAPPQPPAAPQPTDVLEGIEALDVVRGMSLFAGQRALYMQALGYFVDLYGDGLAAVDKFLAGAPGGTREAAGREIHSMGGAAAALGAIELENAAHRIDKMVRGERARLIDDEQLRRELQAVRDAVADLVARLGEALGRRGKAAT